MANKQGLIDHLLKYGKDQSWSELAAKYGFTDSDNARKCWSRYKKQESTEFKATVPVGSNIRVGYMSTSITNPTYTISTYPSSLPSKEEVLEEIRKTVVAVSAPQIAQQFIDFKISIKKGTAPPQHMLELALFDLHIGKLSNAAETGDEYNIDIAVKRYKEAIRGILAHVDVNNLDRILLPIGNDMVHYLSKS